MGQRSPAEKTAMEDKRLVELEIRYTQQQELLQELSDVLYQQGRVIDALRAEMDGLKRKLEAEPGMVDARQQERPPHY
ncbi:SlyX family protein [Corallococcus terminator]|nr:SlyX family protein [Corallococcus terminator]